MSLPPALRLMKYAASTGNCRYHVPVMSQFNPFRRLCVPAALLIFACPLFAKEKPLATIDWPSTGAPAVHFTFGKFRQLPGMGTLHAYVTEITAENLSQKLIPSASFTVYLFDKQKARVGHDVITLTDVGPGETVKFETTDMAADTPVSVSIEAVASSGQISKPITLTVNSTPQGAMLKLDGVEQGTTPRLITVGQGKHTLTFSEEGFITGMFPLEIGPNDVSGGTVNFQLGAAAFDSIEMRDGSVLNGDLVSVSGMDVVVRVGGILQHIDRNAIKRVIFAQRDEPAPAPPTTHPPSTSSPQR
jgi:hypothetical protein